MASVMAWCRAQSLLKTTWAILLVLFLLLDKPNQTNGFTLQVHRAESTLEQCRQQVHRKYGHGMLTTLSHVHHSYTERQVANAFDSTVPMFGNVEGVGEYYIKLKIGRQVVHVQIDTGSSILAAPLKHCKSCWKKDRRIDLDSGELSDSARIINCSDASLCLPSRCSTFSSTCGSCHSSGACCSALSPDHCAFSLRYADNSGASGVLVAAPLTIGNISVPAIFGGILDDSPKFERAEVDGILGLAFKKLACSPGCVTPFFDTLVQQGKVEKDMFSICTAKNGGVLTLGRIDDSLYHGELKYVNMYRSDRGYYDIHVDGMYVLDPNSTAKNINGDDRLPDDAEPLNLPNFDKAIVDSGTTLMIVTPATYDKLRAHFLSNYCHVPHLCSERSWFSKTFCALFSAAEIKKLPTLYVKLRIGSPLKSRTLPHGSSTSTQSTESDPRNAGKEDHVLLKLVPEDYIITVNRGSQQYRCLGIQALPGLEFLGNNIILGNTVLRKYYTVYDRANYRVGFAPSRPNCESKAKESISTSDEAVEDLDESGQDDVPPPLSRDALLSWPIMMIAFGMSIAFVGIILAVQKQRIRPSGNELSELQLLQELQQSDPEDIGQKLDLPHGDQASELNL